MIWEETGTPGRNPRGDWEKMQTAQRQHPWSGSNPGLWHCQAAALPAAPLCRPFNVRLTLEAFVGSVWRMAPTQNVTCPFPSTNTASSDVFFCPLGRNCGRPGCKTLAGSLLATTNTTWSGWHLTTEHYKTTKRQPKIACPKSKLNYYNKLKTKADRVKLV